MKRRDPLESGDILLCANIAEPIACGRHKTERILALVPADGANLGNHRPNPAVGTFHEIEVYIVNAKLEQMEASQIDSVSLVLRVGMLPK